MISVERILDGLATLVVKGAVKDSWHRSFVNNVSQHVSGGNCVSTNQAQIVLKIARGHKQELCKELRCADTELDEAIQFPAYDREPYQSVSIKREVRYVGMDKVAFRFKLDPTVVAE